MNQKNINIQELRDFVTTHKLRNRRTIIHFNAIVSITTVENKISNGNMNVFISFDNYDSYGRVVLMESHLDPNLYPTEFDGKWQTIEHKDNVYLFISGNHTINPSIGIYEVKIVPINKLEE